MRSFGKSFLGRGADVENRQTAREVCCVVSDTTNQTRILLADPHGDLAGQRDRIVDAVAAVIDSGSYILGREVSALEQALAARLGTPGTIGVGCGTDALALGLLAVGVGAGDEVVTVSH